MLFRRLVTAIREALHSSAPARDSRAPMSRKLPKRQGEPRLGDLDAVSRTLKEALGGPADFAQRRFRIGSPEGADHLAGLICFIDGFIDASLIDLHVLQPLMHTAQSNLLSRLRASTPQGRMTVLSESLVTVTAATQTSDWSDLVDKLLAGFTLLFVEGASDCMAMQLLGFEKRGVEAPESEPVVKGPRDGFTETLRSNTILVRRRIRDPQLSVDQLKLGVRTKSDVAVMYLRDVADPAIVAEVFRRLDRIDADRIPETSYLQPYLEDSMWSPFPQVVNTQRPDEVALNLAEGRIAVMVDNSTSAIIVPATMRSFLISPEDYYQRWSIATANRLIRGAAAALALFLPGLYIALISFHPELLPTKLLISLGTSRSSVPFPAIVEAVALTFALEMLTEASVRLPAAMGTTMGVVGGLIIGQAAVNSGLVSAGMVIVVSVTAIGTFTMPKQDMAASIRALRFPVMVAAWGWGLFGVAMAVIVILVHMAELKSFGVPYTGPIAPVGLRDLKDDLLRSPVQLENSRSSTANPQDVVKQRQKGGEAPDGTV